MEYNTERFSPIDIKVKKGEFAGEILHGFVDLEDDCDKFYSEPCNNAKTIIPLDDDNWVEVTKNDKGEWEEYDWGAPIFLSPMGCFTAALLNLNILTELSNEDDISTAGRCFKRLETRMKDAGYISDENDETHYTKDTESPKSIFIRTMNAFYPDTNKDQQETAYEIFIELLDAHGHARKMKATDEN